MKSSVDVNIGVYYDKEGLLAGITKLVDSIKHQSIQGQFYFHAYNANLRLLDSLYNKVKAMEVLALDPNSDWFYVVLLESPGAKVELINAKYQENEILNYQKIIFAEIKARLLDCEEYGRQYGVNGGTVRQWIRRGKLPEAVKIGSGWRVSEISAPNGRSYEFRMYTWDRAEVVFEEEMSFLNEYDGVSLEQLKDGDFIIIPRKNAECGIIVNAEHYSKNPAQEGKRLTVKEKEAFELKLIEHPFIKYRHFYLDLVEE